MKPEDLSEFLKKLLSEKVVENFLYADGGVFSINGKEEDKDVTYKGQPRQVGEDYILENKNIRIEHREIAAIIEPNQTLPKGLKWKYLDLFKKSV